MSRTNLIAKVEKELARLDVTADNLHERIADERIAGAILRNCSLPESPKFVPDASHYIADEPREARGGSVSQQALYHLHPSGRSCCCHVQCSSAQPLAATELRFRFPALCALLWRMTAIALFLPVYLSYLIAMPLLCASAAGRKALRHHAAASARCTDSALAIKQRPGGSPPLSRLPLSHITWYRRRSLAAAQAWFAGDLPALKTPSKSRRSPALRPALRPASPPTPSRCTALPSWRLSWKSE